MLVVGLTSPSFCTFKDKPEILISCLNQTVGLRQEIMIWGVVYIYGGGVGGGDAGYSHIWAI